MTGYSARKRRAAIAPTYSAALSCFQPTVQNAVSLSWRSLKASTAYLMEHVHGYFRVAAFNQGTGSEKEIRFERIGEGEPFGFPGLQ